MIFFDLARPKQYFFQDSATPIMSAIIDFHDFIFSFLVLIAFFVSVLIFTVKGHFNFYFSKLHLNLWLDSFIHCKDYGFLRFHLFFFKFYFYLFIYKISLFLIIFFNNNNLQYNLDKTKIIEEFEMISEISSQLVIIFKKYNNLKKEKKTKDVQK